MARKRKRKTTKRRRSGGKRRLTAKQRAALAKGRRMSRKRGSSTRRRRRRRNPIGASGAAVVSNPRRRRRRRRKVGRRRNPSSSPSTVLARVSNPRRKRRKGSRRRRSNPGGELMTFALQALLGLGGGGVGILASRMAEPKLTEMTGSPKVVSLLQIGAGVLGGGLIAMVSPVAGLGFAGALAGSGVSKLADEIKPANDAAAPTAGLGAIYGGGYPSLGAVDDPQLQFGAVSPSEDYGAIYGGEDIGAIVATGGGVESY